MNRKSNPYKPKPKSKKKVCMDPKIVQAVLERSKGLCEIEGCKTSNYLPQLHHCVHGRGKRKSCETEQSVICLCFNHHYVDTGVHGPNGHNFDIQLKLALQQTYYNLGKIETEVRRLLGGKIYSEDDYI